MTTLLLFLPLLGVVVGGLMQHVFARSNQTKKQAAEARERAYADFLRGVAGVAQRNASPSDTAAAILLAADAKARICVYGTGAAIDVLSKFEAHGSTTSSNIGRDAFVSLVEQMRRDVGQEVVSRDMLAALLFGPPERTQDQAA
ncbi:MAG TPA: hypothetical protein VGM88_29635 [Kofleriaceae bacterium]|jgi:hypothetical protein